MEQVRRIEIAGMSALELGPPDAPVEIVFLHANGFHGAVYAHVLAPLAVGRRIIAPDLRGHGHTTLPADPAMLTSWATFIGDLGRLLKAIDGPLMLAGHSLGGALSLLAAAEDPVGARALMLIEPVIAPPGSRTPDDPEVKRSKPIADAAANRRRVFASRQAAFESYRGRGPFKTWPDEALRAYVEDAFADAPDGAVLRCDPTWEAGIYLAFGSDLWGAIERVRLPLVLRAGDQHSTFPPDSERRLREIRPDADIARVPGATHFLPVERPEVTREALTLALKTAGLG